MTAHVLDSEVLKRIRALELSARQIVDGMLAGAHKSPRHGFAVEFAQHREYVPGDDVKYLDWKVFGRTERYYLKQFELETDLTCWFVLDCSASMSYASGEISKYDYAAVIVAVGLAHLVLRQSDRVGLAVADSRVRRFVRPAATGAQLGEVVRQLVAGPGNESSQLGKALSELAGRLNRRGVVFVVSDFLDEPADILAGMGRLHFDRHDIVAVAIRDPAEIEFPFQAGTLFRGLEEHMEIGTDPRAIRRAYCDEFERHNRVLLRGLRGMNIDLIEMRTDADAGRQLARYLAHRD